MKKPKRPSPDQTIMGPAGIVSRNGVIEDEFSIRGQAPEGVHNPIDLSEASQEIIQLNRRANWYIAMLGRLNSFADESLSEASEWSNQAEAWRGELSYFGATLAAQRGQLSSMQMEQDIITTTVALISKQAETAQAQVTSVAQSCTQQASKLKSLTEALEKQSKDN